MRFVDQLATVVELACGCEQRSNAEQRDLLAVAHKVDRERSKQTTTNPCQVAPYLERLVDESRVLEEGDRRVIPPSERKAAKR